MPQYSISVQDLVKNGRGSSTYETDVKYNVPNSHVKYKADRYQVKWAQQEKTRITTTDELFFRAKRANVPGPSQYVNHHKIHESTTKRWTNEKAERITFTDKIRREQKDKVHPQSYKVNRVDKPRLIGNYLIKEDKCKMLTEQMKKEKIKPAPNTYKTEILGTIKFHRTLPANMNRHKAERAIPAKRDN